jgi:uncharacterized protein involved in tolerance to divalent cations
MLTVRAIRDPAPGDPYARAVAAAAEETGEEAGAGAEEEDPPEPEEPPVRSKKRRGPPIRERKTIPPSAVSDDTKKEHDEWVRQYGSLCTSFGEVCDAEILKWLAAAETAESNRSPEVKRAISKFDNAAALCKDHETKIEQKNLQRLENARKRSAKTLIECLANLGNRLKRMHQRRAAKASTSPSSSEAPEAASPPPAEPSEEREDPDAVWVEIDRMFEDSHICAYGASNQVIFISGVPRLFQIHPEIKFKTSVIVDDGVLVNGKPDMMHLSLRHAAFREGYAVYNYSHQIKQKTRVHCHFDVTFDNQNHLTHKIVELADYSSIPEFQTLVVKDFHPTALNEFLGEVEKHEMDDDDDDDEEEDDTSLPLSKKQKTAPREDMMDTDE